MFQYYHDTITPPGITHSDPDYWHHQHAIAYVNNDPLMFEVICYAHNKICSPEKAEHHPALQQLNLFWQHLEKESYYEAGMPFIQIHVGHYDYVPLIPCMPRLKIDNTSNRFQQDSSVIIDDCFLITFLASPEETKYDRKDNTWLHHTVYKQPFLLEKNNKAIPQSLLAWHSLQGLRYFHINFPEVWTTMIKKYGGRHHEIH